MAIASIAQGTSKTFVVRADDSPITASFQAGFLDLGAPGGGIVGCYV